MVRIYLENMVPSDVSNAVRKTLADLHERGYKIALGSSSRNAKIILKKLIYVLELVLLVMKKLKH